MIRGLPASTPRRGFADQVDDVISLFGSVIFNTFPNTLATGIVTLFVLDAVCPVDLDNLFMDHPDGRWPPSNVCHAQRTCFCFRTSDLGASAAALPHSHGALAVVAVPAMAMPSSVNKRKRPVPLGRAMLQLSGGPKKRSQDEHDKMVAYINMRKKYHKERRIEQQDALAKCPERGGCAQRSRQ